MPHYLGHTILFTEQYAEMLLTYINETRETLVNLLFSIYKTSCLTDIPSDSIVTCLNFVMLTSAACAL